MKATELKSVNLKEGSIIELQFWINENKQIQEDWTIVKIQGDYILYSANCVVSYVTNDFVKVILPETGLQSCRYSKKRIDKHNWIKIVRI